MHPTLFTIGRLSIPTYTVLLDLGLILALVLTYFEGKRQLKDGAVALDMGLWAVIGGIVGGRIAYVLVNWTAFNEDWLSALRIWEGGLSFHGAFLGGLLVMALFAQLHRPEESRIGFWRLGDVATPGLALAIALGWAACLLGGCAYGAVGEGFGYAVLPDLFGIEAPRFATQAVGLGYAVVLFIGFWLLRGHWPFAGASFLMYLLLYFAGQFFLGFARGDEAIYVGPWRLAQVLDLVLALAAGLGLLLLWWRETKAADKEKAKAVEQAEGVLDAASASSEDQATADEEEQAHTPESSTERATSEDFTEGESPQ
jgi:phosphatidylglycerol:prolipoprotein diacylglycerol transferase